MTDIILTIGLPRCGKSTWSKQIENACIVNRDSIRIAHHGQSFIPQTEDFISVVEVLMVKSLIKAGNENIIIDATHISERWRARWRHALRGYDVSFKYKVFPIDVELSKERALDTKQDYLLPIIDKMKKEYEPLTEDEEQYRIIS